MTVLTGGCLCGGVQFEISGPLSGVGNCYCSICRRYHAAAFRTRARLKRADFRITQGEELITFYQSSTDFHRGFCKVCGSPVYNHNGPNSHYGKIMPDSVDTVGIALGSLHSDPGVRPETSFFVTDKAPWYEITDGLPQYASTPLEGPPIRD